MDRKKAINELYRNAKTISAEKKSIVMEWDNLVGATGGGYIPGYIPYIGKNYFSKETEGARILFYALSQNMKPEDSFAINWAKSMDSSDLQNKALNRQNLSYEEGINVKDNTREKSIMMYPFDTGHLPVVAAMLLNQLGKKPSTLESIYDVVAATNLSKYSFRNASGRTTDSSEALNKCHEWFTKYEIEILKPDYIICAGNAVKRTLKKIEGVKIVKIAFPSLLVINRRRKKDDACRRYESDDILSMLPKNDHKKNVAYEGQNLKDVIKRDTGYFSNMYSGIEKQLKCIS